jgi:hypothetical protein
LFPRYVELLDDLVYGCSGFKVLEDSGNGHSSAAKHPRAAKTIRHAFNGGTLRPVKSSHGLTLAFIVTF